MFAPWRWVHKTMSFMHEHDGSVVLTILPQGQMVQFVDHADVPKSRVKVIFENFDIVSVFAVHVHTAFIILYITVCVWCAPDVGAIDAFHLLCRGRGAVHGILGASYEIMLIIYGPISE